MTAHGAGKDVSRNDDWNSEALAAANVAGGWLGTHLALRHGAGFVRWFFILGVSLLVGKMLLP